MIAFLMLTLGSLMESTKVSPQFMSIFGITHMIEDIFAKAPVECIFCFCIPPVVLLLITNEVSRILDFRKPFGGGSKTPNVYGFEVHLHAKFLIWKIIFLKDGRWSFPIRHLALGG
jgi:hypothetical protein